MKGLTWKEVVKQIDWKDLEDVVIEGVYSWDYPKFCDAFIASAKYKGVSLGDFELDYLADAFPSEVNEMAYETSIGIRQ